MKFRFYLLIIPTAILAILKKCLVWVESLGTDVNKKADIRIWLAIAGIIIVFKLALDVPTLVDKGKTFDILAYGGVMSILVTLSLTLFGISKSSLDSNNDTEGTDTSITDDIQTSVKDIVSKFTQKN